MIIVFPKFKSNKSSFEEEPVNSELFMNFDFDIPACNTSVEQETLKQGICDMFIN